MRRILAVLAVATLIVTACGDDEEEAAAPVGTDTTTPTIASTVTTEPAALGDSDDTGKSELEDGRHFGYWDTFEIGDTIAFGEFDLAYFLTGAEAEQAAAERGDEVNNDYYIVNDNPKLRTLIARGDTEVLVLASQGSPDQVASNVADFAVDRHENAGFWVTIDAGIVTKIEEQYQP